MIERTIPRLLPPLRPRVLTVCAGTSAALFSLLLVVWLLCWVAGGVAFGACWVALVLMVVVAYGLVLAVAGGLVGGAIALFGNAKSDDEQKGAGCVGCGLVLLAVIVGSYGFPAAAQLVEQPKKTLAAAADDSLASCGEAGDFVLYDVFVAWQVWLWSWTVLAASLTAAALALLAVLLLRGEGLAKRVFVRVRFKCPRCPAERPAFRCPGCGDAHEDLRPSIFGLIEAACPCGQALPALDVAGRLGLEKVCGNPACNHDLKGHAFGRLGESHFAVVGAQSSGKSNLLVAAVRGLVEEYGPRNATATEFTDPRQKAEYDGYVRGFGRGDAVPKTASSERSLAFNLALNPAGRMGCLLYLYDAAGEDFEAGDLASGPAHGLAKQDYHGHIDGVVFVVDPFAEEGLRQKRAARPGDNPARFDAWFLVSRLLPFWERVMRVGADRRFGVPVAVVVTKADACGLEGLLKSPGAVGVLPTVESAAAAAEADSDVVRQFLIDAGAGMALRMLESRFAQVKYFGVTALGRAADAADRSPFRPRRVVDPVLWLCQRSRALSDESAAARSAGNALDFALRCLKGREGAAVRVSSWSLLACVVSAACYGAWSWLGTTAAVAVLGVLALALVAALRYAANGVKDAEALTAALASAREWYGRAIRGACGPRHRLWAYAALLLAVATLAALATVWWPLGVGGLLVLLGLVGLSQLGR